MKPREHITRRKNAHADETSNVIMYEGANLSQLSVLFRMDHRVLVEKLHQCPPTGVRNGTSIWRIDVAAPYLVRPMFDIEEYVRKMNPTDLPKMLSKEFWSAQKIKQEVQEREGNLWQTERVVRAIGGVMKIVKNSVRLFVDAVDRQSELNEAQRRILKNLGDGLLNEAYRNVVKEFSEKPTNPEQQEAVAEMIYEVKQGPAPVVEEEDDDEL
jgi:hypothetical protein